MALETHYNPKKTQISRFPRVSEYNSRIKLINSILPLPPAAKRVDSLIFLDYNEALGCVRTGSDNACVRQRTQASKFGVFTQAPCVRQIGKTKETGGSFSSFSGVRAVIVVALNCYFKMNVTNILWKICIIVVIKRIQSGCPILI